MPRRGGEATVLTAAAVWRIAPGVVRALDERLGNPDDSYVNGTQLWLRDAGEHDGALTLEWRLHPVPTYRGPKGLSPYEVWDAVTGALAVGDPSDLALGDERRGLSALWEGLECYVPFDDEVEPATLARIATGELGIAPEAAGLVDHDAIGRAFESSDRDVSITGMLLDQLEHRGA